MPINDERTKNFQTKVLKAIKAQENPFHLGIETTDHNHHIPTIFVDNPPVDEVQNTIHKTDLVDRIVKIIRASIQDYTLIKVFIPTVIENDHMPTCVTNITQMIVLFILQSTARENI